MAGRRGLRRLVWLWAAWGVVAQAQAYGHLAHRLIAGVAEAELAQGAQAEVRHLLQGETLVDIASWADDLRETRRETARWHYLNIHDPDCRVVPRDCPDGQCLPQVLDAELARLADRGLSRARRAEALKFVVHLYSDLHQPLHLGFASDKGGNTYQVSLDRRAQALPVVVPGDAAAQARRDWWKSRRFGYNLHALWDTVLFESAARAPQDYLQHVRGLPLARGVALRPKIDAVAQESCRLMRSPGFYPDGHRIGRAYVERHRPEAEARLKLAGVRLARLLERVLVAR